MSLISILSTQPSCRLLLPTFTTMMTIVLVLLNPLYHRSASTKCRQSNLWQSKRRKYARRLQILPDKLSLPAVMLTEKKVQAFTERKVQALTEKYILPIVMTVLYTSISKRYLHQPLDA